jgi:hypothetical protein
METEDNQANKVSSSFALFPSVHALSRELAFCRIRDGVAEEAL